MEIGSGLGYASGPVVGGYLYLVRACTREKHNYSSTQFFMHMHILNVVASLGQH